MSNPFILAFLICLAFGTAAACLPSKSKRVRYIGGASLGWAVVSALLLIIGGTGCGS